MILSAGPYVEKNESVHFKPYKAYVMLLGM